MALETGIQARIIKYLNAIPNCRAENVSGSAGQRGRSDINGCYRGRAFKLEVKSAEHDNTPSDRQVIYMRKWSRTGAVCATVYSLNDVKYLFGQYHTFSGTLYGASKRFTEYVYA